MVFCYAFVTQHITLFGHPENRLLYFNFHLWNYFPEHLELKDETACLTVFRILRIFYYSWLTNNSIVYGAGALPPINLSFDPCYVPEC